MSGYALQKCSPTFGLLMREKIVKAGNEDKRSSVQKWADAKPACLVKMCLVVIIITLII